MVSFDVKALFTNVPVDGAMRAVQKVVDDIDVDDLPLPKLDFIKQIALCTKFSPFIYNQQEYFQHNGLGYLWRCWRWPDMRPCREKEFGKR